MALISRHGRARALLPAARRLYRDEALRILDAVGMREAADHTGATLAYGDVKRVELAIALVGEPKLLLMDEPTAGMAPGERAALMGLTARLARERGLGVLFTEHDMSAVFAHADRVLVLVRGAIIAAGAPEAVRADPRVRQAYLGESGTATATRARA
jgi:branched-chain amino acid transport system ATP-binding protein